MAKRNWTKDQKDKLKRKMDKVGAVGKNYPKEERQKKLLAFSTLGLGSIAIAATSVAGIYATKSSEQTDEIKKQDTYIKYANQLINSFRAKIASLELNLKEANELASKRLAKIKDLNQQIANIEDEIEEDKEFNNMIAKGLQNQLDKLRKEYKNARIKNSKTLDSLIREKWREVNKNNELKKIIDEYENIELGYINQIAKLEKENELLMKDNFRLYELERNMKQDFQNIFLNKIYLEVKKLQLDSRTNFAEAESANKELTKTKKQVEFWRDEKFDPTNEELIEAKKTNAQLKKDRDDKNKRFVKARDQLKRAIESFEEQDGLKKHYKQELKKIKDNFKKVIKEINAIHDPANAGTEIKKIVFRNLEYIILQD